jgi:hypothetical protein
MNKIIFSLVIIAFSNGFISQIKFDSLKLAYNETHIDIVEGACFGKKNQFLVTYTYEASHFFLWDVNSNKFLKKINVSHKIENITSGDVQNNFIIHFNHKSVVFDIVKNEIISSEKASLIEDTFSTSSIIINQSVIQTLKKIKVYLNPAYGEWKEYLLYDHGVRIVTDLSRFIVMNLDGTKVIFFREFLDYPIFKLIFSEDRSKICIINSNLGDGGTGNKFVRIYDIKNPTKISDLSPSSIQLNSLINRCNSKFIFSTTDSSIFKFNYLSPNQINIVAIENLQNVYVGKDVYATVNYYENDKLINYLYRYDSLLRFKDKVYDENLLISTLEINNDKNVIVTSNNGLIEFELAPLNKTQVLSFSENYTHNPFYHSSTSTIYSSCENKIYGVSKDYKVQTHEIFNIEDWDEMLGPEIKRFFIVNNEFILAFLSNGDVYKKYLFESKAIKIGAFINIELSDVDIVNDSYYISGLSVNNNNSILYKMELINHNNSIKYNAIKEFNYIIQSIKIVNNLILINDFEKILVLDLISFKTIYSFEVFKNNNWLVKLPNSPYYMCSKDASKMLHYVTPSLKVIGFEQLDPVYNRPDIVLDSIGKYFGDSDGGMIDEYRKSWEKRIDRLGLDKEKLGKGEIAVPNAEIVGADAIAYENKNGKLDIKVAANDPKYPLRRFNVYVNEVPMYGSAGISIAHLKKQVWDTTVSVPLSIGENKIQVSVMNELGLENFKYPSYVNYTPSEPIIAKTYYIGIGVNEFKESTHNLKYCVKDVTDLSMSFGGPNTEVKLFTNAQVTKENILALKDYLAKTTVNDKVIISCSSHGLLDDSLNFYLAMHDVDFNNPKARGLKYEELENLLDGIPARQKLLLLDACNSGENDKTELIKRELEQKNSKMDSTQILAARGVIIKLEDENKSNFKKMNELFVNVRNNTGSVIISAAGGQESALEAITVDGKSIENGAFSYCVLEYLKNNSNNPQELTVNKLKNYVEKRVEEITNGKQQPTSRQETMEIDWGLR